MNLIKHAIPALLLGLSGLTLGTASQADSSFSIAVSGGYPGLGATYAYHDGYRPYARTYDRRHRPPAHVDTYVEKRVYRDYGHRGHYREQDEHRAYNGRHHEKRKYRDRDDRHSRRHGDRHERRRHTGYARTGYY